MDQVEVPDVSTWVENLARRVMITYGEDAIIGRVKFFFRFDQKHLDARIHKKMQQCVILYAFSTEAVGKTWVTYAIDGDGEIYVTMYSAILVNRKSDTWAIGLPNEPWFDKCVLEDGKVVAMTLTLKTANGMETISIPNPDYKK